MGLRPLALGFLAAAFCACETLTGNPTAQDPFAASAAAAASGPKAYKDLSAAYFLSPGAKVSIANLKNETQRLGSIDPDSVVNHLGRVLRDNFRSSIRAGSFEEARNVSADVAAVLDIFFALPEGRQGTVRTEVKLELLNSEREPIDVVKAEGSARVSGFAPNYEKAFVESVRQARAGLERELRASRKLAEFSRSGAGAAKEARARAAAKAPAARSSPIDKPSQRLPERPNDFALVIGIEKYAALPEAQYAERDAAAVREHLIALGYPARNVVFLTGSGAGKASIQKYLESWLPLNVAEESKVFVFFSGHGAPDPRTGMAYLVPWDGDAKYLDNTAYPVKRLYESLGRLKAKQVVLAMDSCFSGAGGRSLVAQGTRPLVAKADIGLEGAGQLVVLAAASGDEITGTFEEHAHGLFTYYLLKGLSGEAKDGAGKVTVRSLYDYLVPQVRSAARRENRDQTPQLLPQEVGERGGLSLW